ncbi:hypothetical protein AB1L30_14105 [Bremerella sp. JC817]
MLSRNLRVAGWTIPAPIVTTELAHAAARSELHESGCKVVQQRTQCGGV